jgi:hypothetical protein
MGWKLCSAQQQPHPPQHRFSTNKVSTATATTTNCLPRFCRMTLTDDCCCRCCLYGCCCYCCSTLDYGNPSDKVRKTTTTISSSQRMSSAIRLYNPSSTMKNSFHVLIILVLLLPRREWRFLDYVTGIAATTATAASAAATNYYGDDSFSHHSTLHNQRFVGKFSFHGGEQIPFPGISSNTTNNNNSSTNNTLTNTYNNDSMGQQTRRGTIPPSGNQESSTTNSKTTVPLPFRPSRLLSSSTTIRNKYHSSPVSYQYFARKHVHHKHSTLQSPTQQQQQQHNQDSIHFIILGPNVDHWKEVGPMLASRGFNVMVCERVDDDDADEGDAERDEQSIPGALRNDDHPHDHPRHHLPQEDAPELVLRIMGTLSHIEQDRLYPYYMQEFYPK